MNATKPEFPFKVGEVVGWKGQRCIVIQRSARWKHRILIQAPSGIEYWTNIAQLHEPPPLAPHVQEAADSLSAFLADPQKATFGGES